MSEAILGFAVETRRDRERAVIVPRGELDLAEVAMVRAEIKRQRQADVESLVLDLSELAFIDSAGMHLAADEAAKGDLTVVAGNGQVRRAFALAGLQAVISTSQTSV